MSLEETQKRLAEIVNNFPQRKVVVVGDTIADQFLYGEIARVSREAPVFILRHERTETVPGGASNCAVNLAALGARTSLIGTVGDDEAGRALTSKLKESDVDCRGLINRPHERTTTKVRILAGQIHSVRQQVIRIDYEGEPLSDENARGEIGRHLLEEAASADAVIISDYNYGVADPQVCAALHEITKKRRIPVLVDSRFRLSEFPNFTSATPNEDEVEHLLGQPHEDESHLALASENLRQRLGYQALLVTRGSLGMILLEEGRAPLHMEPVGAREAVDGTGAGDTVISAYTLALSCGASFADAAMLANHAGGLVVMKRGTASVSRAELQAAILQSTE